MHRPPIASLLAAAAIAFAAGARADGLSTMPTAIPDFDSFMLMRVAGGAATEVSTEQAADALKDDDVIFLGEWHDHIANHLAEMALLRAIHTRSPELALSMEQFERDVQPVVDDYLAGKIGEETLKAKGRAWSNYAEAYRPLVEYAKDHGLPVIAANAPASIVRCVGREGAVFLETLPPGKRGWAAADLHTEDGPYKDKFMKFLSGDNIHGGPPDADAEAARTRAENSFAAQVTRDDTMADSIANYLRAHPGHKVVHVTGAFHVEDRLGTVERLKLRMPNLKTALVLPVEAGHTDTAAVAPDDAKGANFLVLLRPEPKPYVTDEEKKAAEAREAITFGAATQGGCEL